LQNAKSKYGKYKNHFKHLKKSPPLNSEACASPKASVARGERRSWGDLEGSEGRKFKLRIGKI
jgi:hypothetical protein